MINGGQGAQLMKCSMAELLCDEYEKVYLIVGYRNCAELIAKKHDNIVVIEWQQAQALFATVMQDSTNWMVYNLDPYRDGDFELRRAHFFNICKKQLGLPQTEEDKGNNGAKTMPIYTNNEEIMKAGEEFYKQHHKFVMLCIKGGMSCLRQPNGQRAIPGPEVGLLREYPVDKAEKLVEELNNKGYQVLQVCLPEEVHIKGTICMNNEVPMEMYGELAKYAECVITVDSSLMHFAINKCKKMIVLWRETAPTSFGYEKAINLKSKDYKPTAPLFSGIPDTPVATPVSVEEILKNV